MSLKYTYFRFNMQRSEVFLEQSSMIKEKFH